MTVHLQIQRLFINWWHRSGFEVSDFSLTTFMLSNTTTLGRTGGIRCNWTLFFVMQCYSLSRQSSLGCLARRWNWWFDKHDRAFDYAPLAYLGKLSLLYFIVFFFRHLACPGWQWSSDGSRNTTARHFGNRGWVLGALCGAKKPKHTGSKRLGPEISALLGVDVDDRGCFFGVDVDERGCFLGVDVNERGCFLGVVDNTKGIRTRVSLELATAWNERLNMPRSCPGELEPEDSLPALVVVHLSAAKLVAGCWSELCEPEPAPESEKSRAKALQARLWGLYWAAGSGCCSELCELDSESSKSIANPRFRGSVLLLELASAKRRRILDLGTVRGGDWSMCFPRVASEVESWCVSMSMLCRVCLGRWMNQKTFSSCPKLQTSVCLVFFSSSWCDSFFSGKIGTK